ncbi:hypothetical protein ACWV26_13310 [Rummeliibacillus sp. JY-2-4R]
MDKQKNSSNVVKISLVVPEFIHTKIKFNMKRSDHMVFKEDIECLERLMTAIEYKLSTFESRITHMHSKLEELKRQERICQGQKLQLNRFFK